MGYLYRSRVRRSFIYSLLQGVSLGIVLDGCGGSSGGDGNNQTPTPALEQPSVIRKLSSVEQLTAGDTSSVDILSFSSKYSKTTIKYGFFSVGEKEPLALSADRYRLSGEPESIANKDWLIVLFEEAFQEFSSITNLKFEKTTTPKKADISYFIKDYNSGLLGFSKYPKHSNGILDKDLASETYNYEGSPLKELLLHELGHGLGLDHPFKGSSYNSRNKNELTGHERSTAYTVEAYTDMPRAIYFDGTVEKIRYQENLGLYDILALQSKYGKNKNYRSEDDSYDGTYFQNHWLPKAIWDGGGTDVIDVSDFTFSYLQGYATRTGKKLPMPEHEIDLRPGNFGSIGIIEQGFLPRADLFRGHNNLVIAFDAEIENAIGGDGADLLIGNKLSNSLEGKAGDDVLEGLGENDILVGGGGDDILLGGDGTDVAFYDGNASSYVVYQVGLDQYMVWGMGVDLLEGMEILRFRDGDKSIAEALGTAEDLARTPYVAMSAGSDFTSSFVASSDVQWIRVRVKTYGDVEGVGARLKASITGGGQIEGLYNSKGGTKYDSINFSHLAIEQGENYYLKIIAAECGCSYRLRLEDLEAKPDLAFDKIDFIAGNTAYARSFLYYKITIANKGTIVSNAANMKIYISSDNKLDDKDHYVGIRSFDAIRVGANEIVINGVTVPDYAKAGKYYVIFQLDSGDSMLESDEDNNIVVQEFEVGTRDGDMDLGIIVDNEQRITDGVSSSDTDTFTFTLEKASLVNLFLDKVVSNIKDFRLSIKNKGATEAIVADEDSYIYNGLYASLEAGAYELSVSTTQTHRRGYTLHISVLGEDEQYLADDYAENSNTEGLLDVAGTVRGFIEKSGDVDWLRIDLEADTVYTIEMKGQAYGHGTLADPTIYGLVDSSDTLIQGVKNGVTGDITGDKSRDTKDAEIATFFVDTSGTYYLKLGSGDDGGDDTGSYRVLLNKKEGSNFSSLLVLNSMPDIEIEADDTGIQKFSVPNEMFHHYFYAVDGKRDVFELTLLGNNALPSWVSMNAKTGEITVNTEDISRTADSQYDFRISYGFVPDGVEIIRGSDIFSLRVRASTASLEEEIPSWYSEGGLLDAGLLGGGSGDDGLF